MVHARVDTMAFHARLHKNCQHAKHILERDMARVKMFRAGRYACGPLAARATHDRMRSGAVGVKSSFAAGTDEGDGTDTVGVQDAAVTYNCTIFVGANNEQHDLLIDTGSSNTWLGNETEYRPSSTSQDTRDTFQLSYGSGSIQGSVYSDSVKIGSETIDDQLIGVADRSSAQGFDGVDGILGIGPVGLTVGTVQGMSEVPTVTDNLFKQGKIQTESIGISYVPTTSQDVLTNGELTFGGTDPDNFTGDIQYVPITKKSPANNYWGIDQTVTYGGQTLMSNAAGIVDTGTTLLMISSDAFSKYQRATGAKMDRTTGLLKLTEAQFNNLESMMFQIGDTTFEFTPDAQIWPRSLNSVLGGDANGYYAVLADMGEMQDDGLTFIDGFVWLQRFYSVYDTTNNQVGIANTEFTTATTNANLSAIA